MISILTVIVWIFLLTMYPISLRFLTMKQTNLPPDNLSFSAYDLENIVYALDAYITENDDKIANELKDICYKIECVLDEVN